MGKAVEVRAMERYTGRTMQSYSGGSKLKRVMFQARKLFSMTGIVLIICGASPVKSAEQVLTIEEAVETAWEKNHDLLMQELSLERSLEVAGQVKASRLPVVETKADYRHVSELMRIETPLGTFEGGLKDTYDLKLTVKGPLFTGFRLENLYEATLKGAEAEELRVELIKQKLESGIGRLFYASIGADKYVKTAATSLDQVEAHLRDVRNFYELGMMTRNEVLKAELKKSEIKMLMTSAELSGRSARLQLYSIMGVDLQSEMTLSAPLEYLPLSTETEVLTGEALANRIEVRIAEKMLEAAEKKLKAEKGAYWPQAGAYGAYDYGKPGANLMGEEWMDSWSLGVSVGFTAWDWGSRHHQVREEELRIRELEIAKDKVKHDVERSVIEALLKLEEADQRVRMTDEQIRQAEENFRLVENNFQVGLSTNTDFLDAQSELMRARLERDRALVDHCTARINLKESLGMTEEEFNDFLFGNGEEVTKKTTE